MKKEQKINKTINFDDFSSSYEDQILKVLEILIAMLVIIILVKQRLQKRIDF